MQLGEIAPIIIAIIAALPGLLALSANTRKARADMISTLTDASLDLVTALKSRLTEVETELARARKEQADILSQLQAARYEIETLKARLSEANIRISQLEAENAELRKQVERINNNGNKAEV